MMTGTGYAEHKLEQCVFVCLFLGRVPEMVGHMIVVRCEIPVTKATAAATFDYFSHPELEMNKSLRWPAHRIGPARTDQ